jgi:hypothetical protein
MLMLFSACTVAKYTTDYAITQNILLPPTGQLAHVVESGEGLDNLFVLGEETIPNPSVAPDFLAVRGGQLGAQYAVWLGYDTLAVFWHWEQSCDTCDYYASTIKTINSKDEPVLPVERKLRKAYSDLKVSIKFLHHAIYLLNPESMPLQDRILAIEFYDNHDSALVATAWFDWNEQLDSLVGDKFVVNRFMNAQPIGFLKQTGPAWQSYFNPQLGVLRRRNDEQAVMYRIVAEPDNSFSVFGYAGGSALRLTTAYYGMHDWALGSPQKGNPYQVDFKLDANYRVWYMHIKDKRTGGLFENHVRIYYRSEDDNLPTQWRWPIYYLARTEP